MQLAREPLCRDCKSRGLLTPGEHVDHIIPKRDGGENALDNLQTLCETCHARKTVLHDGGFGRAKRRIGNANGNGSFDRDGSDRS
jgi:5-methylcytosine-specific restriction protein A